MNFPTAHEFIGATAKTVGTAFYEAGRQMAGGAPQRYDNPFDGKMMSYSDLPVLNEFSAIDLDNAFGVVMTATASVAIGYSACNISAWKGSQDTPFFALASTAGEGAFGQGVVAGTAGVGLGGEGSFGVWRRI